ncbi:hypothetical protein SLEP1_g14257 [Rubroshorea leprosula]|uniref:G-patch domain-containing protein n=1 Tax=Rubroshorea leprosula TaxID=152421 RepID=A0AAV5IIE3_9ROSI|nr:hypothetical protein SLEP1_g14257 [Rubroshorea leprosula]
MSEENIVVNLQKSAVDERVDKLEATMQTLAATLQTISLTLSTLTTGSRAKDPMVTQLQFPPIYENQPLVGESSSHAPQISSLPFETSHPPLEMNNPTLPTTIPPLMGQVPTIQTNPLVEILRPTLEDGRSREVDHKLQQLEEALKAMQGPQAYGSIDLDDLCYYLGIQTNFNFKQPDFDKYDGSGCPYAHLQMYARKMAPYANDERVLIHYFQDNLSGPASVWFLTLDKKKIRTFRDVSQAFMKPYEYNMSLAPTRDSLQRITKKGNETFKEFAQRWRSEAAKVIPPLTDSEICSLFIKSTTGTFRAWLAPCVGYTFAQLVIAGEQIEEGLKAGIIMDFQTIQRQLEQVKMGSSGSTSKRPTTYPQRRPNFNAHAPVRQQFPSTNRSRQFTKLPIPYSEVLKQLVAVGLIRTVQANPVQPPYPYGKTDEIKSAPSITQNPLPPHGAPTMNMVAFDEVDGPVLKNVSAWSLDELFAILVEYDLIQPIAPMSLDVLPVMLDEVVMCPYHSNMKGHALQDCEDFQRKVEELQAMGSLKFMSTPESEKFIAPVTEEYFTKERPYTLQSIKKAQIIRQNSQQPYVLKTSLSEPSVGETSSVVNSHIPYSFMATPQHVTIMDPTTNDVSNMTRSGRCYVSPEVEESRKAALKSKGIRIEEILEESPKKLVPENEVAEFLNILRKSEYSIIEQLSNTPAKISILELMLSFEVHLDALLKVLKEAHVPKNIDTQKLGTVVGAILAPNYINFTDDEIPDEGNGHTKALHISVQLDESHINQCNTVIRAFDGTKRNVIGKIELPVEIGPMTFEVDFFVMDISPTFNMLLGRPWIHVAGAATTIPYLGVDPGTYESSYHSMECAAASYIHPRFKGKRVEMAKPTKVAAKIMLACHYQLGEGLGLNGQGILEPIEVIQAWATFGLGYKPKKEDWQRMRAIKAEKRLARLQGRDPRDEPMWVPHIRVTFP